MTDSLTDLVQNNPDLLQKLNNSGDSEKSIVKNIIGWNGCHPHLDLDDPEHGIEESISLARADKDGNFVEGIIQVNINKEPLMVKFQRGNDFFEVEMCPVLDVATDYDVIAFVQRGGHGPRQASALDIMENQGLKTAIFTPQAGNFTTKADVFSAKYLDEVGFTTNLRKDNKGEVHTSLPTDPSDERFLLSLMAVTLANWQFFLHLCNSGFVIVDSKSEIGALACAVKRNINKDLRIALVAYTVFEDLSKIPSRDIQSNKEFKKLLTKSGLKDFGVPDGHRFMLEKVNSVKNKQDASIVYMTFGNQEDAKQKAQEKGFNNVVVIPQISKPIPEVQQKIDIESEHKIHLMRLNSSFYAQAPELLSTFVELAKKRPDDKFNLIAKEDQLEIILPNNLPGNFEYLGWSGTDKSLINNIVNSHSVWVHGGNRPSVIEALHVAKRGVIPFFFTQDKITNKVAEFWGKKKFSVKKLLALMMAVETQIERLEIFHSILNSSSELSKLVINPLDCDLEQINRTIDNFDELRPIVTEALDSLQIADTKLLADIYLKLKTQ